MIPSPKLDDRAFDDIVAEAVRLIPRYCPEWTNHNPSDPGITLIELAAWMTDVILYRLNRVPEKNYVAFLNLLGIKLKPPQAARALLTFILVEGAERQTVREGTQVATPQAADEDTVTFETTRDLLVTKVKLDRCYSYWNETYNDNSPHILGGREGGFEAFAGAERVERYLYLGDSRFAGLGDEAVLRVFLGCPDHGGRDLARLLEWEYWNGDRWKEFQAAPVEVERGEAAFRGPAELKPVTVHGIEDLWVRGRLAEVPQNPQETEIDTVRVRVEVVGEGVAPDRAIANLENNAYIGLDLGKNMWPFGKEPKVDCCLYLACHDLLRSVGAEIRIELTIADTAIIPSAQASDDLAVAWEYWDGRKWRLLGKAGPRGLRPGGSDEFGFRDESNCLTKSGVVSFYRPKDMAIGEVNGEENYWVRGRIEMGDYGRPGVYSLENDKWVWKDEKPLRPPALRSIAFRYREEYKEARHVVSYNDFRFKDLTEDARTEYTLFQPFDAVPEESPTLYLGFDSKFPNEEVSIFFQMAENLGGETEWETEQRVLWEYHNGQSWVPLTVRDGTKGLVENGFVDFAGPDDAATTIKFTEERHWLRARLEHGGYVRSPRVQRILLNTVEARHFTTLQKENLGSSDGTPLQTFKFTQGPLLEGAVIEVREREPPSGEDLEELGENAVTPAKEEEGAGVWVRWINVDSFFQSGPTSRHYLIDYQAGKIQFGDGRRGHIPQEGRNNVVAKPYRVGGGAHGNVNANTLTAVAKAIAYIEAVNNYMPAAGGADAETVEEAKERAPYHIKSQNRAVTAEDFEMMALRASTSLARAKCLPDQSHQGQITLVLVPKMEEVRAVDLNKKLVPSAEILRYVKKYLDERRLVGTLLNVVKPRYQEFSLKVALLRRTVGANERLRREIEERLRKFLHPLHGGRDEKGWSFGRPVLKSDLIHLVEEVPGVDAVDSLQIFDEERRVAVEQVRLEPDQLPHVVVVTIVEKVREEIV
jgi:baseplate J-like protein